MRQPRCNGIRFTKDELDSLYRGLNASKALLQQYLFGCLTYGGAEGLELARSGNKILRKLGKLQERLDTARSRMP